MTGIELSQRFFDELARPVLACGFPALLAANLDFWRGA